MIVNSRRVESRNGAVWEVEFPTMINGHEARWSGFLRPVTGYGPSQFFSVDRDTHAITWWDFEPYEYVKKATQDVVKKCLQARGEG